MNGIYLSNIQSSVIPSSYAVLQSIRHENKNDQRGLRGDRHQVKGTWSLTEFTIPSNEGYKQSMVVANGLLHSLDHCSIAEANQCFTKTHAIRVKPDEMEYVADFDRVVKGANFHQDGGVFGDSRLHLPNVTLIHVPSQNIILLIGANCQHGPSVIWKYEINTKLWTPTGINTLWFTLSSAILTTSEKVVVIAGYDKALCNKLYILNIEDPVNYTLNHCTIGCPVPDARNSVLSVTGGDVDCELLVIGWIKKLFETENFSTLQLLPLYLMQSVVPWLSCEQLHWIYRSSGAHYAINMHHVVSANQNESD